jgi:dipeptidyl aminopeptidase/acylaminoacyl peptidase
VQRDGVAQAAVAGQALPAGSEVLTRGEDAAAVLRYDDDTRLEVGPATHVRLEAGPAHPGSGGGVGKRVLLLEGGLGANVRPQPEGLPLVLRTPHAEVTARGTRFTSTSSAAATRIELQEGRIEVRRVEPPGEPEEVVVAPGSYVVVSPQTRRIALDRLPPRRNDAFAVLTGTGGPVLAVAFLPDGNLVCLNGDGSASVWDVAARTERRRLERPPIHFTAMALSPDGRTLALGGADRQARTGWVTLWETATGREGDAWRGPREVHALAFSPDGKTLAVGGAPTRRANESALYTLADGALTPWPNQAEPVLALAFAPDGKTLAVGARDGFVRLYDPATNARKAERYAAAGPVQALAYSADGLWLAVGGKDGVDHVCETATGREEALLFNSKGPVTDVAFAADARLLLTAGRPGFATLWDRATGRELTSFQGHKAGVAGVAVSPDGRTLATAGWDRSVRLWRLLPPARWWRNGE